MNELNEVQTVTKPKRGRKPNAVKAARFTMSLPGDVAASMGKPYQAKLLALAVKEFRN